MTKLVTLTLASALALASCTTDVTTSATSQEIASNITVTLWDSEKDNTTAAFWETSGGNLVSSMQYFIQKGDAGGVLTGGYPTFYVWLVSDANHVYKVWRVARNQYGEFINDMRAKHGAVLAAHPSYFSGGAGTPDGGDLGHVPHIGPHGDGTSFFSQDVVDAAITAAGAMKTLYGTPSINGQPGTGWLGATSIETSGW